MPHPKTFPSALDRRRFLRHTWQGVGPALSLRALARPRPAGSGAVRDNPFTLGRSLGRSHARRHRAVDATGAGAGRTRPASASRAIPVGWRVANDGRMRHVVARAVAFAPAELAHSVHVEVDGLRPGRDYFYQFDVRGEESAVGHFRTAPARPRWCAQLRFAFATCQDWPSGYYTAYRDMVQDDLDLVLHLGDYTYEYAIDGRPGEACRRPRDSSAETVDLRTYRLRHTLYKLDPDLQAAHARFPFVVIWDDHEVQNDYSGLAPEGGSPSPEFTARRAAAYQAYYEHMPIRLRVAQRPSAGLRIYRRLRYGKLAEFTMLDDRQYRSDNPCGDGESLRCTEAVNGNYTMLGREQEHWVGRGFARSDARWNIVGQQLLLAELEHTLPGYPDEWEPNRSAIMITGASVLPLMSLGMIEASQIAGAARRERAAAVRPPRRHRSPSGRCRRDDRPSWRVQGCGRRSIDRQGRRRRRAIVPRRPRPAGQAGAGWSGRLRAGEQQKIIGVEEEPGGEADRVSRVARAQPDRAARLWPENTRVELHAVTSIDPCPALSIITGSTWNWIRGGRRHRYRRNRRSRPHWRSAGRCETSDIAGRGAAPAGRDLARAADRLPCQRITGAATWPAGRARPRACRG